MTAPALPRGVTKGSPLGLAFERIDALGRPVTPPATFEGCASLPDLLERGREDQTLIARAFGLMRRTIADQVTGNNLGVIPPAYLAETFGLMAAGRPAVEAFGVRDAGEVGMSLEFPYRSSDNVVAAVQTVQKTQVQSVRVDVSMGDADLSVFAAGSDVSLQLWKRSSPSYRELYSRELASGLAVATEQAFVTALEAGATTATQTWDADTTGESLLEALYAASIEVEAATRAPATFALAASDVFGQLPRLERIVAPGTRGAPARVEVPGFGAIIHTPALSTGRVIVSNPLAGGFAESGPYSHLNPDVAKLGMDVSLWSVGAAAIGIPAGIVSLFGPGASGS